MSRDERKAIIALLGGFIMITMDSTAMSVVLPTLLRDLSSPPSVVLWISNAYMLMFVTPLLLSGKLGDRFGQRRVFLIGLTLFILGALVCWSSAEIFQLVSGRIIQGFSASLVNPQILSLINRMFEVGRRGTALSLWGAVAGAGALVGPLLGGYVVSVFGWRWLYFGFVPFGLLIVIFSVKWLPNLPRLTENVDWIGIGLSGMSIMGLMAGLQFLGSALSNPTGSVALWLIPLLLSLTLLVVFLFWERSSKAPPLLPARIFSSQGFSSACSLIFLASLSLTTLPYPLMLYLQSIRGLSATNSALLLAPYAGIMIVVSRPLGKLIDRANLKTLCFLGLLGSIGSISLCGFFMYTEFEIFYFLLISLFLGISTALLWGPTSTIANMRIPFDLVGVGAGLYNLSRQFGSLLGIFLFNIWLQLTVEDEIRRLGVQSGTWSRGELPPNVAHLLSESTSSAVILLAGIATLGMIPIAFFRSTKKTKEE